MHHGHHHKHRHIHGHGCGCCKNDHSYKIEINIRKESHIVHTSTDQIRRVDSVSEQINILSFSQNLQILLALFLVDALVTKYWLLVVLILTFVLLIDLYQLISIMTSVLFHLADLRYHAIHRHEDLCLYCTKHFAHRCVYQIIFDPFAHFYNDFCVAFLGSSYLLVVPAKQE